jgi:hypothetical protein
LITITEDTIDSEVIEFSLKLLEAYKQRNIGIDQDTCTENGFQTPNVIDDYSNKIKIKLLKDHFHNKELFWLHLIEYFKGGFQKLHDHERTEQNSFILHLNDADGNTSFFDSEDKISLDYKPKKGKIYYFSSNILHQGKPSYEGKKVLVGALTRRF